MGRCPTPAMGLIVVLLFILAKFDGETEPEGKFPLRGGGPLCEALRGCKFDPLSLSVFGMGAPKSAQNRKIGPSKCNMIFHNCEGEVFLP